MKVKDKPTKDNPAICICHQVPLKTIEAAIKRGCKRIPQISDATTAGVGPCGGSCKPFIQKMIDHYVETGEFMGDPRKVKKD